MKKNKKVAITLLAAIALSIALQANYSADTVMAADQVTSVSDNTLEPSCNKHPINDED